VIEEEKNEETEETPQGSDPSPEPAEEPAEAQGSDPTEEEAPPAEEEAPAPEAEADAEPAEELGPKERRRRKRSAHTGEARAQRSPEERAAGRTAARQKKAAERSRWRRRSRERRRSQPKTEPLPGPEHGPGRARVRQGIVVSDKADKTITVRIDITRRHRMYKKIVRESSTLHAHDERNEANAGDTVLVIESRPLSRSKRWRLVEIVERAR